MKSTKYVLAMFSSLFMIAITGLGQAVAADPIGEPGRASGKPNPLKNVYFGEEHMHTRNSFDAFTIGVNRPGRTLTSMQRGRRSSSRPPASA